MKSSFRLVLLVLHLFLFIDIAAAQNAVPFDIVTSQKKVAIVYDASEQKLDSIAAHLLAEDIKRVTGYLPQVFTDLAKAKGNVIVIGTVHSKLVASMHDASFDQLNGNWECYCLKVLPHPAKEIDQALVITGSDARGTAYGVFDLSGKIGVSPWYWWADVQPGKKTSLTVDITPFTSQPPSVKFRGIFINDEDWGLQPWAAKTLEPETGDIGPKTYAKVFELLLRLKANLIWPAMHPSTKAFFHYPGNVEVAEDYQIVVGSSHAEPMLRNNVGEWNEKTMGPFNYVTNQQKVDDYWESRVKESSNINAIYSIGMRGVHDSGIEGVKTVAETVPLLERIFADQRAMLKKYVNPDISKVPQAFTPYKEVLDIYDGGLHVPDDVTLVWPDDNYGYIQRLSDANENKRSGGAGVYYHVSYWGRPHDYLWLSTTHPALIREEMMKAYDMNARNIWVVNVGDIKPAEYNIQLFLDMAYNTRPFADPAYSKIHLTNWYKNAFGEAVSLQMGDVMWKYYDLAFERKPEFMGWSRTEPTTKTTFTQYNPNAYGDQIQQRLDAYAALAQTVKDIAGKVPAQNKDAFFQLVDYPVTCAGLMNQKFLYRDKADFYAQLGGVGASEYEHLATQAYDEIKKQTDHYNSDMAGGKWKDIMSMAPRKLPVFDPVTFIDRGVHGAGSLTVVTEGELHRDSSGIYHKQKGNILTFDRWTKERHFFDLILQKQTNIACTIMPTADWIKVDKQASLSPATGQAIKRLWIDIDWLKAPHSIADAGIIIRWGTVQDTIRLKMDNREISGLQGFKGFVPSDGYIAFNAADLSGTKDLGKQQWKVIDGLGGDGKAIEAWPLTDQPTRDALDTTAIRDHAAVTYNFYTFDSCRATFTINTLPTSPINKTQGVRYAVSIDNGPINVLDFRTSGRSEEWKANVLSNTAQRSVNMALGSGKHKLVIYMIDPGVIVDRVLIDLGGRKQGYGPVPLAAKLF